MTEHNNIAMKILILGAGKMGTFFCDLLSPDHDVAVYDPDADKLRFTYGVQRFSSLDDIGAADGAQCRNSQIYPAGIPANNAAHTIGMHTLRYLFRKNRSTGILCRMRTPVRIQPSYVRTHFRIT